MDFDLSKPQKMLQKSVKDFLDRSCSTQRVRELMATENAVDDALWSEMVDQGWTTLTVPEEKEGMGLTAVDLAAVSEVMGRYCLPGPFISNQWATTLLSKSPAHESHLPDLVEGESRATVALLENLGDWDPSGVTSVAAAENGGYRLRGEKMFVNDAASAGLVVWAARLDGDLAFFAVQPSDVDIVSLPAIDETRKLYRLRLPEGGLTVESEALLLRGDDAEEALRQATLEATVAVCAELVGGMDWVLGQAVEYAKTREQFGRTIGHFQAVQHLCADMLTFVESARSATYFAAWDVAQGNANADETVSIAKAYCSDAAREVGNKGIQVHGGIGFTWEHDLQLYYKRAKSSELLFGDAGFHRERLARRLLDN